VRSSSDTVRPMRLTDIRWRCAEARALIRYVADRIDRVKTAPGWEARRQEAGLVTGRQKTKPAHSYARMDAGIPGGTRRKYACGKKRASIPKQRAEAVIATPVPGWGRS
jgi:hypothetical protein